MNLSVSFQYEERCANSSLDILSLHIAPLLFNEIRVEFLKANTDTD